MAHEHPSLTVNVVTGRGTREFSFRQETKIAEVINQVVSDFGYPPADKYVLTRKKADGGDEELAPERPLVSYGIEDGATLVLTAIGTGV